MRDRTEDCVAGAVAVAFTAWWTSDKLPAVAPGAGPLVLAFWVVVLLLVVVFNWRSAA